MSNFSYTEDKESFVTNMRTAQPGQLEDMLYVRGSLMEAQAKVHKGEFKPSQDGGSTLTEAIEVAEHSFTTGIGGDGFTELNMDYQEALDALLFRWSHWTRPVMMSGKQIRENAGKTQVIDLGKQRQANTMDGMSRELHEYIFKGRTSVGTGGAQLKSIGLGHINGLDYTDGYLEQDLVGAQTNTIGGISRAAFVQLPGMQNLVSNAQGSFNTFGLAGLDALQIGLNQTSKVQDHTIFVSEAFMQNLRRAARDHVRFTSADQDLGRPVPKWEGKDLIVTSYMPDDGTVSSATPVSAVFWPFEKLFLKWMDSGKFAIGDPQGFNDVDGISYKIIAVAQLIMRHWGSAGMLVNGNTF